MASFHRVTVSDSGRIWRILVVDDDQVDRESVRRSLRRAGLSVKVVEADSGSAALALLSQTSFDCVFLDYNLPGADGLTLLAELRRAGHDVPVVALTGHGDTQVAVQLMKAGAADYVAKAAATPERLASSLRYATELARAQADVSQAQEELRLTASRARFLAEASALLARSLDVRTTLEQIASLSVSIIGDYCLIYLVDDEGTEGIASAHRDPNRRAAAKTIERNFRPNPDHPSSGLAETLRTRRAKVMNGIPAAHLDALARSDAERDAFQLLAPTAALFVPLNARSLIGAITFCRSGPDSDFTSEDLSLAQDLADRAATAIENARLYELAERARQWTELLQGVTAKLSAVVSRLDVANLFVVEAQRALGASTAWLALLTSDKAHLQTIASTGIDPAVVEPFSLFAVDAPLPTREALLSGAIRSYSSKRELLDAFPNLRDSLGPVDQEALLILPLSGAEQSAGVMALGFRDQRSLSNDEIALGVALAQQCAQALERARLYDAEHAARAEAEAARRDAEEANRAKSEFLARMSHDLRTPLNAIAGYSQLILEGVYGEPSAGQRESLTRIRRAQEHLLALINDVLGFARLEAGQVRMQLEDVPLQPIFDGLSALIEPQVAAKGLVFTAEPPPLDGLVRADKERLTQILLNLATNAVKFTEPGGRISLSAQTSATSVLIRVSDTGRGIAPQRLDTIFEPFVQGGRIDEERQGVGLGLAIGRELARMMAGDLRATSELGRGSCFVVTLPRSTAIVQPDPPAATRAVA